MGGGVQQLFFLSVSSGTEPVPVGRIVDTFSFLVGVLLNAVFSFFGTQVRVRAPVKAQARYKDREDKVL